MLPGRVTSPHPIGRLSRRLAFRTTAGLIVLLSLSCGSWKAEDAFNALQIAQVQSISGGEGGCVVSGTASTTFRTEGTLDVYLPDNSYPPYLLPLLVANNLDSAGGSKATEMNNITLTHFTVTLSAPGMTWPDVCPATFDSEQFTIALAPGATAGYAIPIIRSQHSACLLAALAPQPNQEPQHVLVTAKIVAKGRHGGTSIESAPFLFGVDVCTGCLQDGYTDPALVIYRYPAGYPACNALTGTNPYPGDPCLAPGQDAPILCCGYVDASGNARAVCPAVPTGDTTTDSNGP
jgi:hypothetical protein